ncbi:uncharacterized protein LY89DRAFT_667325 [Mollisia scopiformis]|uniref:Uncharacterized protein n=1 Tax=Mollisia scopiformis TaxID=149040 RepID=A0A194XGR6_MOLSC|nr:uncharacterized protein LY89DRAFT_667325 [Mollisia scopiformis]KUJ19363.1 hypothetical protein LY89DRAFT_667325 [Mollisia scopiformis]
MPSRDLLLRSQSAMESPQNLNIEIPIEQQQPSLATKPTMSSLPAHSGSVDQPSTQPSMPLKKHTIPIGDNICLIPRLIKYLQRKYGTNFKFGPVTFGGGESTIEIKVPEASVGTEIWEYARHEVQVHALGKHKGSGFGKKGGKSEKSKFTMSSKPVFGNMEWTYGKSGSKKFVDTKTGEVIFEVPKASAPVRLRPA